MAQLQALNSEENTESATTPLRPLCPTRMTVKYTALSAINEHTSTLPVVLDNIPQDKNTNRQAQVKTPLVSLGSPTLSAVLPGSPPSTALKDPVPHAVPVVDLPLDLEIEAPDDVEFDYACPQPSPQYEPMSRTPGIPEQPTLDWCAMEPYFPFHAIAYQGTQTDPVLVY